MYFSTRQRQIKSYLIFIYCNYIICLVEISIKIIWSIELFGCKLLNVLCIIEYLMAQFVLWISSTRCVLLLGVNCHKFIYRIVSFCTIHSRNCIINSIRILWYMRCIRYITAHLFLRCVLSTFNANDNTNTFQNSNWKLNLHLYLHLHSKTQYIWCSCVNRLEWLFHRPIQVDSFNKNHVENSLFGDVYSFAIWQGNKVEN